MYNNRAIYEVPFRLTMWLHRYTCTHSMEIYASSWTWHKRLNSTFLLPGTYCLHWHLLLEFCPVNITFQEDIRIQIRGLALSNRLTCLRFFTNPKVMCGPHHCSRWSDWSQNRVVLACAGPLPRLIINEPKYIHQRSSSCRPP